MMCTCVSRRRQARPGPPRDTEPPDHLSALPIELLERVVLELERDDVLRVRSASTLLCAAVAAAQFQRRWGEHEPARAAARAAARARARECENRALTLLALHYDELDDMELTVETEPAGTAAPRKRAARTKAQPVAMPIAQLLSSERQFFAELDVAALDVELELSDE